VLGAYRVLDLTDERGQLCGHVLASLGAEVIAIEPPDGAPTRRMGPFWHDQRDPEASLQHWSFNRGKRSVVLDLGSEGGRADLLRLVEGADVVVESAEPGVMTARGLGYDVLSAINPGIVHASITAFGSDGPKAGWAATDLPLIAAGGQAWLTGDADRAPLRISVAQAYHHAAADAACGVVIALHERIRSGRGQHVDTSAQQSMLQTTQSMVLAHALGATELSRMAGGVKAGPIDLQLRWACKDGNVSVTFFFGAAIGPFSRNLMHWVWEEGFCDEATRDKDWINYTSLLLDGTEPIAEFERVKRILDRFFATKTKAELLEASQARRLLVVPVTTIDEVVESPQLAAREYWQDVDQPTFGTVRYPGALAKFSATPLAPLGPPPRLGADTEAILAGSRPRARPLEMPGSRDSEAAFVDPGRPALDGLKVLDLCWVMAGPAATRVLADYGATVVRVESSRHLDTARGLAPFRNDSSGVDDSGLFNNMNAGKLGLALDLTEPRAREVLVDLVRWADVVVESFSPRAMRSWGLDYESLRAVKPDVIMASSCLMGQTGPLANLAGYGTMAGAISGWFNLTGWPDRPPCGPFSAYTDYVSPRLFVSCILAAIEHRRRTGQGQYIDLSQAEASLHLMSPPLLDYTVNGTVAERAGNDDPMLAPHGIYRAAGTERWVAIACRGDADFAGLCQLIGRPDLAGLDAGNRRDRRRELDGLIETWTQQQPPSDIEVVCQAKGIAAHRVNDSADCFADPQLVHRRHFVSVEHSTQGTTWVEGSRFRLSRTPARVERGGPNIGQHTWEVLTDLLGYDADHIADLAAAELLE
jgi:crotonobetainyl-CoA:carnitine CoA-transferase CaiB-like acyl-CoA transferase